TGIYTIIFVSIGIRIDESMIVFIIMKSQISVFWVGMVFAIFEEKIFKKKTLRQTKNRIKKDIG
ncbi:40025_t:CDS:1, partial [Gigaspora margarita]